MRALHYINFLIIFLILIGICVIEDVIVSNSLKAVQTSCYKIERMVQQEGNLKNMDIVLLVDNLEDRWIKDENKLCYLVHHKNIQEIGQEISKLKLYIPADDIDAFRVSLSTIRSYCHGYHHFMGASWHNVL